MVKLIRAHIFVKGKVQGVSFRQNMRMVSKRLKVNGWVRNLRDRRVEVILEGVEMDVTEVIEWCHVGTHKAKVDDVNVEYEPYKGEFDKFTILY